MKKLLIILLLLPFAVSAQTTYQLNYDSIRVNKIAGTGGTSLYGKVYLKNVSAGLSTDSALVVRNGRIFKFPAIPTLSFGTFGSTPNAQGGSYSSGVITLQPASASFPGGVTTGTQIFAGDKTIQSSGSGNTLSVNHASGNGAALNITKGGNGEGLYVNKTSGSGNAATIIGTLNATTLVKSGGTSSQFLKADGTVDGTAYGTGSVTSVAASAGTGISISGSPITTSGTINITNTAPDQTVVLTAGTGISTSGTYPNFTITNTSPSSGGTVTSVGLSSATSGVTIGATPVTTSGTITLAIATASGSQNGLLSSTDWTTFNNKTSNTGTVTSVGGIAGTGISISGSPITTSGSLTITNTAPDQTVVLTAGTGISTSGTYPNFTITNTSPSSGGTVTSVAALTLGTTGTDLSSTVANGTTTPVITLNVPTASAANRGALSSADWTTFNNKAPSVAGGYLPLSGGTLTGALSGTSATFSSSVRSNSHMIVSDGGGTSVVLQGYIANTLRIAAAGSTNTGGARGDLIVGALDVGSALSGTSATFSGVAGTGTRMVEASSAGLLSATQIVTSGTYTPTLTNQQNVSGATILGNAKYQRIGNIVTVFGSLQFTTGASLSTSVIGITLPIASNFTDSFQARGVCSGYDADNIDEISIVSNDTNDRASLFFETVVASQAEFTSFSFSYEIL